MFTTKVPYIVLDMEDKILSYLNAKDLARASGVNKIWHEKTTGNHIWSQFFQQTIPKTTLPLKDYFNHYGIVSLNQLIYKIKVFIQKLNTLNGELYCHFPSYSKCYIGIQVRKNPTNMKIKEHYWFFETFILKKANKDFIMISGDHSYTIHVRLPKDPKLEGFISKIASILS